MAWFTIEGKRIAADAISGSAGNSPRYVIQVKVVDDAGVSLVDGDGRLKVSLPPGGASLTDDELRASALHVIVDSIPASGGGLTNAELRAAPVDVDPGVVPVTDNGGSLTVDGAVAVSNFPATQAVSAAALPLPAGASTGAKQDTGNASLASLDGKVTACDTTGKSTAALQTTGNASLASIDGKTPALVGGKVPVDVVFPVTQPVSIAATVAVSGPLTDAQLRAAAVPVSGTFYQATQPVSAVALPLPAGASTEATLALIKAKTDNLDVALSTRAVTGLTDAQLRASAVPVSGPLTDTQLRAAAVPVSGSFFPATQPISAAALPLPAGAAQEHATAASPHATRLTDGAAFYDAAKTGQLPAALVGGRVDVNVGALPTLTKGTQGATGVSCQDLKDAGRTKVAISFNGTGAVADALLSLVKTLGSTAAGGAVSIAVTAGKTLRITHAIFSVKANAAAAAFARYTVRHNAAGAAVLASPAILTLDLGLTAATIGSVDKVIIPFPDGWEFSGTDQIAISAVMQATTNIISITLVGYEY